MVWAQWLVVCDCLVLDGLFWICCVMWVTSLWVLVYVFLDCVTLCLLLIMRIVWFAERGMTRFEIGSEVVRINVVSVL